MDPDSAPLHASSASNASGTEVRGTHFVGVLLCFVLSGFAALLFQTAWMRQFSIVFGTSELAVATVLAAYMAGLALGAWASGRFLARVRRPVLVYGLLELGIALGALAVPLGLALARGLQAALIGGQAELQSSGGLGQLLFYLASAFAVILIPTAFMGATLPLLTRQVVRRDSQVGSRVGILYAMNTAGAVAGTLTAAFVLLPELGLARTVWVGCGVNAIVFALAVWMARSSAPLEGAAPSGASGEDAARTEAPDASGARSAVAEGDEGDEGDEGLARASWILPLILISGSVSFLYEVLWTRLISQVTGGSVSAFATMLASFLTGITLGGAIASAFARTRRMAAFGFLLSQLGIAWLSIFIWQSLGALPARFQEALAGGSDSVIAGARVAMGVLLPAALCIGATFPFALRVLARGSADASRSAARVYSWNTLGAILGAVLAGFWLIPALGFDGAARLAVATNLLLALAAALILLPHSRLALGIAGAACLSILIFRPETPEILIRHTYLGSATEGKILYSQVGRSATVLALDDGDSYEVRSNGLPEARILESGSSPYGQNSTYALSLLPVLARPQAKSMMVIGFGGGVTLESVAPSIESLDVIELEPEILEAGRVLSPHRAVDPFLDPRLELITGDARGALALTDERWDIIVSQPSHPWTAGASHLYTLEFLELAKQHLEPGGVFVQWMSSAFLDERLFRSIGATLLASFEHVRMYQPMDQMLVFLASDGELAVEREIARSGQPMAAHPQWWSHHGIDDVNDVLFRLALETDGLETLCAGARPCSDDQNLLAMEARPDRAYFVGNVMSLFLQPVDPLLNFENQLNLDLAPVIRRSCLVSRMAQARLMERAVLLSNAMKSLSKAEEEKSQGILRSTYWLAQWEQGETDFRTALEAAPEDQEARFLLVAASMPLVATNAPGTEELQAIAAQLSGPGASVLQGFRLAFSGQVEALGALEPELAATPASHPAFGQATYLRAYWRLNSGAPGVRVVQAQAALELIDRSLIRAFDPWLLVLRADAGQKAARADVFARSLAELARFLDSFGPTLAPGILQMLAQEIGKRMPTLKSLSGRPEIPDWQIERISGLAEAALGRVSGWLGASPQAQGAGR